MINRLFNPLLFLLLGLSSCFSCQDKDPITYEPPTSPEDTVEVVLPEVDVYVTKANGSQKLTLQSDGIAAYADHLEISVDPAARLQVMDGFGFAITGGTAAHLQEMTAGARSALLNELFGNENGQLGLSFIRISIGASDLDEFPFSYADTPGNQPDPQLESFSLSRDTINLIPTLKEILAINPAIKIMASPWSPPVWMKSNKSTVGGKLLPEYYTTYATYFVKYIQSMEALGIVIDFVTPQNEPLHDGNNPSLHMTAAEQGEFIKNHLGPAFVNAGITSKIVIYDHNADRVDYPLEILEDELANPFVYGSAFHLYGGQINALSGVHSAFPDKRIYFTEQWYGAPGNFPVDLRWHLREIMIGAVRNWAVGVIEWNLSSNPSLTPRTDGGCSQCLGAITINGDQVIRNAGYFVVGHTSAFVPPGSQRIGSNFISSLPNVAYLTPNDQVVLIVLNDTDQLVRFNVEDGTTRFSTALDGGSVATFVWNHVN